MKVCLYAFQLVTDFIYLPFGFNIREAVTLCRNYDLEVCVYCSSFYSMAHLFYFPPLDSMIHEVVTLSTFGFDTRILRYVFLFIDLASIYCFRFKFYGSTGRSPSKCRSYDPACKVYILIPFQILFTLPAFEMPKSWS
jgi:hypothetical protein